MSKIPILPLRAILSNNLLINITYHHVSSFPALTLTICLKKTKEMPMHQLLVPWSNLYTCDFFLRCSGAWGESDSIFFIPWCDWQQILLHTFIICKNSKMVLLQRRAWQVIKINVKEKKRDKKAHSMTISISFVSSL